ncbi:hypothetical protein TNCV_1457961 [Trichonephila clavipes]|nr:hypothetical protein TNCV_1457961 [Trichonephila clavipes]
MMPVKSVEAKSSPNGVVWLLGKRATTQLKCHLCHLTMVQNYEVRGSCGKADDRFSERDTSDVFMGVERQEQTIFYDHVLSPRLYDPTTGEAPFSTQCGGMGGESSYINRNNVAKKEHIAE